VQRRKGASVRKLLSPLLLAGAVAAVSAAPVGAELEYCMVDPAVTVDHTTVQVGVYTTDEALLSHVTGPIQITLRGVPGASVSTNPADWNRGKYPVQLSVADDLSGHASAKKEPFAVDAVVPSANSHARYFIKVSLPDGHVYEGFGRTNAVNQLRVEVPQG
jgi:hypothetical protein